MTGKHWPVVDEYARSILDGTKPACDEDKQKCERFRRDLENPAWEFRPVDADFVIGVIESTFVHEKGEAIDGSPMMGKPFLLEPFQKFHIYNLLGFWIAGTKERKHNILSGSGMGAGTASAKVRFDGLHHVGGAGPELAVMEFHQVQHYPHGRS